MKIEINLEEIADVVADRVRSQVLAMLRGAAQLAQPPEPDTCSVSLRNAGDKKIEVIKEIRAITGLGLQEAKCLVESAPVILKSSVDVNDAIKIKAQLEN